MDPPHHDHDGMNEDSIREHEEVTKVKNINNIELGRYRMETWYFSPFPKEYYADGIVDTVGNLPAMLGRCFSFASAYRCCCMSAVQLYFCEFCLKFFKVKSELQWHMRKCKTKVRTGAPHPCLFLYWQPCRACVPCPAAPAWRRDLPQGRLGCV